MHQVARFACVLVLLANPARLHGQLGWHGGTRNLSPRTQLSYVLIDDRKPGAEQTWFQLLILWRGRPEWRHSIRDTSTAAQADREYEAARKQAVLADAIFLGGLSGGISYVAQVDRDRVAVTLFGQRFALPQRDSALVVLVDNVDRVGGSPSVVRVLTIDGRVPATPRPKTWTSGDTVFTIRVPDRSNDQIMAALQRDSAVAAFWP